MTVYDFIEREIDKTTKLSDKSGDKTMIPLPYPFTAPCAENTFTEMYYWDTYFTNKCLYLTGRETQAVNNVKNLAYLLKKFGKIPNGNRKHYLGRSQPPFFGLMLKDVMLRGGESGIDIPVAYELLKKEYAFWQKERSSESGLNAYNSDLTSRECLGNFGVYREVHTEKYFERTGIFLHNTVKNGKNVLAEYESGWDFSPRFNSKCTEFNAVDLNCLLFADEMLLYEWAKAQNKKKEASAFYEKALTRKEKIKKLCLRNGVYYDFNYVIKTPSFTVSAAAFFPFFTGLDDDKESFIKTLGFLERDHGVVATKSEKSNFQWAEPNGWAPLNYVAVKSADNLGLKDIAARLAEKFLSATEKLFKKTGRLWEKYNAVTGDLNVSSEYATPEMLGWTAGVYAALFHYKKSGCKKLI